MCPGPSGRTGCRVWVSLFILPRVRNRSINSNGQAGDTRFPVLIVPNGRIFDDENPKIVLHWSVHYERNPFSVMKLVTQREIGGSLKMALRELVWVGLMNLIHFAGAFPPPTPMCDARRRPRKYREADSQSKIEQLGISYMRTPRRRLWVTELACRKKFDSVPPTQNSEET